jgi:cold shock CspA family protein
LPVREATLGASLLLRVLVANINFVRPLGGYHRLVASLSKPRAATVHAFSRFTLRPSSTRRRMASESVGLSDCFSAHRIIAARKAGYTGLPEGAKVSFDVVPNRGREAAENLKIR